LSFIFLIVITVIVIDPVVNYSLFLYEAKELDDKQGVSAVVKVKLKFIEF